MPSRLDSFLSPGASTRARLIYQRLFLQSKTIIDSHVRAEEGLQGLKVKKLASGTKTTWQLGENKYQNVLWVEKLKGLKEDADRFVPCVVVGWAM